MSLWKLEDLRDAQIKNDIQENAIPGFSQSSKGGLAVVTGGCSGMGLAFATKAAQCGMIPIVLDMDTTKFPQVEQELRKQGAPDVFTAKADVSKMEELAKIASDVQGRFPMASYPISVICANAGYGGPPLLDGTVDAIQKQVDVLTMGVIWTFKAFQDRFLGQKAPCALVATSSVAGIVTSSGSYGVGKHGALAVMESLHEELWNKGARHVKTYVLCPGLVSTGFFSNGLSNSQFGGDGKSVVQKAFAQALPEMLQAKGMPASHLADQVWDGIETGRFYIVVDHPNAEMNVSSKEATLSRHRRLEAGAPPGRSLIIGGAVKGRVKEILGAAKSKL